MKPRYIANPGGKQPVLDGIAVEIVFTDSTTTIRFSHQLRWSKKDKIADIIAYRVIEQE